MSNEKKLSFPKEKIKIVLFDRIHPAAEEVFEEAGYRVTHVTTSPSQEELIGLVQDAHIIGVRSRTKLRKDLLVQAKRLMAVGCFTVGTDQVDLDVAGSCGVPAFNAPHSSTRSVAELAVASMFALARRLTDKSAEMHRGTWNKSAEGASEVRNKTLGLIGYGHIGQQVGLLAESIGMDVLFYDAMKKLPLGRARMVRTMEEVLSSCDYISLHVPGSPGNAHLIGNRELKTMRKGSFLLNVSRGSLVDLDALAQSLREGHLGGAAVDVFPEEPKSAASEFSCPLQGIPNVVMTPHLGGSTEEAQRNIGREVAQALIKYIDEGSSMGAVNFPQVQLPTLADGHRILNVHRNVPGALNEINQVIAGRGVNIDAQYLATHKDIGYLIMDIDKELSEDVRSELAGLSKSIKTRLLF